MKIIENVLTTIYITECAFKVISYGFFVHPSAYLRSYWNALDFLIVIISILDIFGSGSKGLKALRTLRILRPFKAFNALPRVRT